VIVFEDAARDNYLFWQQNDKPIRVIQREPFDGIGKPEALKLNLNGFWSRRINEEHRIVYKIEDSDIIIAQCRGHYD
jgi:toxin YoeB